MISFLLVFNNWALLVLRVVLGVVLMDHGLPKLRDLEGTATSFKDMGLRPGKFWASIVAVLEFFGGIALIAGLFVQPIAVLLIVQFLVIVTTIKKGTALQDGLELDLLILAVALMLATAGGGALSLDGIASIFIY